MKRFKNSFKSFLSVILVFVIVSCASKDPSGILHPKISLVNSPTDILTVGAGFLASEITEKSSNRIRPKVYHSGVLSGGKGSAEIEMCQQGSIEIHITTTAYLANLVPKTSIVSLPFLFRDIDQVIGMAGSHSPVLQSINRELNAINLNIIAWWPRGFRQLTNNVRQVRNVGDLKGLGIRVMNNRLYVDNMNIMGANPVPMDWGEVYNSLQLNTIDGQENAEDVIFSSRIYEVQKHMTIWDYSTDIEIVLVNFEWWNNLSKNERDIIQQAADTSIAFEVALLRKNTEDLRRKIAEKGVEIYYLSPEEKRAFREAVRPVWEKYEKIFSKEFLDAFLEEVGRF